MHKYLRRKRSFSFLGVAIERALLPAGSVVKNVSANAEAASLIPGSENWEKGNG